ncbi:hypothetical protein HXX02_00255 [Microbulbifer elongatus]|uniref:Uncharacterized protein n=1 Tax=Microbulbifer elongatus TaxID=86173 RepID=A0ABT1NX48_9GAMM|nr:hypothetical protein [Microbulbifer elongatus]MCQ3827867.1 hypothetical protein [Microbulbifer elongatus]
MESKKAASIFLVVYIVFSLLSLAIGPWVSSFIGTPIAWIGVFLGPASFLLNVESYLFKEIYLISTLCFLVVVGLIIYMPKNKLLKCIFGVSWLASGYIGVGFFLGLQQI